MAGQISFFTKDKPNKRNYPVVRFTKDCKDLNKDFIKDSEFELFDKRDGNAVIRIDETYYTIYTGRYEIIS